MQIYNIEFLDYNNSGNYLKIKFKCLVSKGTYIRSLIKDICDKLGVIGTMSKLTRTKQGNFNLEDCIDVDDIALDRIINIKKILNIPKIYVDDNLKNKILNGQVLNNIYKFKKILFLDKQDNVLAIYQEYIKDKTKIKPYVILFNK